MSVRRGRRVVLLSFALVLMGLGDLYATLLHSEWVGMRELNPIAASLLSDGHVGWVVVLKLASMALCVGLLMAGRRHRVVEAATWGMAGVMLALTLHWSAYNLHMRDGVVQGAYGADYLAFGREMGVGVRLAAER